MEEVGVEAIVKGLSAFLGDMGKINSSLQGVRGEGSFLQRAFASVTDGIVAFGEHVARVAEVALGVLLRDAIRAAIDFIGDLINSIVQAGNEFQLLTIRLTGFNLDLATKNTSNFTDAMAEATDMTKEQLDWLQTLGAVSPFDPKTIADVFTQARAYGFTADEAKRLTKNTIEYTSAMGLGNQSMESVIRNLGQMKARGKITSTELRDLSRSAFLPLDDVLGRVAKSMGVTTEELNKLISKPGEGVPFQNFIDAFNQMVEDEPRFIGAAGRLSRAFLPATANVKELATSIGGLNIVTPILDFLGEKVAGLVDEFVSFNEQGDLIKTDKWEALVGAAQRVGDAIVGVLDDLFNLLPSTDGLADGIISGLGNVADWLETHRQDIVDFVQNFVQKLGEMKDTVLDFINNKIIPAWDNLKQWYDDNKETISQFFSTVGEIAKEFFSDLMGGGKDPKEEGKGFLDTLTEIMQYVIDNKDEILKWVEVLWSVFAVWTVISTVLSIVSGVFLSIAGFILGLVAAFAGLVGIVSVGITVFGFIAGIIAAVSLPVIALIAAVGLLAYMIAVHGKEIQTTWEQLWFIIDYKIHQLGTTITDWANSIPGYLSGKWSEVSSGVSQWWSNIVGKFNDYVAQIKAKLQINWSEIGENIMRGIRDGINAGVHWIVNAAQSAAQAAYNAALSALGIHSPSKLFFEIGANTMEGMALGIQKAAGMAAVTMQGAMARVASAAVPSVTNSTIYNSTQNNTLNINSNAPIEPIIQDFNMMQSLAGV